MFIQRTKIIIFSQLNFKFQETISIFDENVKLGPRGWVPVVPKVEGRPFQKG